jgi:HD superfamily phosphodiesterase
MTAMLPAHLTETINNLGDAAHALAEEVRADRAARDAELKAEADQRRRESRRLTLLLAIIGVLVFMVAGLSIYNRIAGNQSRAVIETIESCTTADGKCAREGQKRTEEAIGKLLRMNIEVAACARTAPTDTAYRTCVDKALADLIGAPPSGAPPVPTPPKG